MDSCRDLRRFRGHCAGVRENDHCPQDWLRANEEGNTRGRAVYAHTSGPRGACEKAHDVRGHLSGPPVAAFWPGRHGRAERTVQVESRNQPTSRQRCRHVFGGDVASGPADAHCGAEGFLVTVNCLRSARNSILVSALQCRGRWAQGPSSSHITAET